MRKGAKRYSAYKVTESEKPDIEVGQRLVAIGWDLTRTWEFVDFTDPDYRVQVVFAEREARLCPTCVNEHDRAAPLDHPNEHGKKAPLYTEVTDG